MSTQVERMLPLYEGKMGHQYTHRFAEFYGEGDYDIAPNSEYGFEREVLPRNWVREEVFLDRAARRSWGTQTALMGFRRVARNNDERTVIASVIPWGPASYGWILTSGPSATELAWLLAQHNSFAFDFLCRQFLSQPSIPQSTFEQLPTVLPSMASRWDKPLGGVLRWVTLRVGRLTATSTSLHEWGREIEADGAEWWSEPAREQWARELDALFFHLFGVPREDISYVMDSFEIVRRRDEQAHREYRTKRLVLEAYDQLALFGPAS